MIMLPEGFKLKNESIFERELPSLVMKTIENEGECFDKLLEMVCTDQKAAVEWVCFGESFKRPSVMFTKMTGLQFKFVKDERYLKHYNTMLDIAENHKTRWVQEMYPDLYELYEGVF